MAFLLFTQALPGRAPRAASAPTLRHWRCCHTGPGHSQGLPSPRAHPAMLQALASLENLDTATAGLGVSVCGDALPVPCRKVSTGDSCEEVTGGGLLQTRLQGGPAQPAAPRKQPKVAGPLSSQGGRQQVQSQNQTCPRFSPARWTQGPQPQQLAWGPVPDGERAEAGSMSSRTT